MTDFGRKAGDMSKSTYDTDGDGTVDDSEKLEGSSKAEVQDHTPKSHSHAQSDVTDLGTDLAGKAATTHEHVETDVTDLDHDAQKVKGVIINDAAKADQKVLGFDSATDRIIYIEQAPSGATIKNIQQGTITIPVDQASETATITAVDVTKSVCLLLGFTGGNRQPRQKLFRVELTNSTTVTVLRSLDFGDNAEVVGFCVVEFESGIESIQQGVVEIPIDNLQADLTINEVNLNKSVLFFGGNTNTRFDNNTGYGMARVSLLNSTTIRAFNSTLGYVSFAGFTVLEFK